MKKPAKIILINVIANVVFSLLFAIGLSPSSGGLSDGGGIFLIAFGTISLILGTINFIIALIYIAVGDHYTMKSFFIASGVLFLIGLGVCGPVLMFSAM